MKNFQFILLIGLFTVFSCDKDKTADRKTIEQYRGPAVIQKASLYKKLPAGSLAYIRLPNMWSYLLLPKGTIFDQAFYNAHYVKSLKQIRSGIEKNVVTLIPDSERILWLSLVNHMVGPLELVVVKPKGAPSPMPFVYVATKLNYSDINKFRMLVSSIKNKGIDIMVGENGFGSVKGVFSLQFHYDAGTGNLRILFGMAATDIVFKELLQDAGDPVLQKSFAKQEQFVDGSHQSFYSWFDMEKLVPFIQMSMSQKAIRQWYQLSLNKIKEVTMGLGISDGMVRFVISAKAPNIMWHTFLPRSENNYQLKTSGQPSILASMAIPSSEQFRESERKIISMSSETSMQNYLEFKKKFRSNFGMDFDAILESIGPELAMFIDDVGGFAFLRLRNKNSWQKLIAGLEKTMNAKKSIRNVDGLKIHEIIIPNPFAWQMHPWGDLLKLDDRKEFRDVIKRWQYHFYWVEEGEFLVFSSVPQFLMDRGKAKKEITINKWLKDNQRQRYQSSIFQVTGRVSGIPRYTYSSYIQSMQFLSDIALANIDVYALPTANQINLPKTGSFGLQLNHQQDSFGLEVSFENNPLEMFAGGGGITAVAVVGILAAIAIPAYHDYVNRAKVMAALATTIQAKRQIELYYKENGRFPSKKAAQKILDSIEVAKGMTYEVQADTGEIRVHIEDLPTMEKALSVLPVVKQSGIFWRCAGIAEKFLPRNCRSEN